MNPLFNAFQNMNPQIFRQNFGAFAQNFKQQSNIAPQAKVQELLNSGQMSQQQFNQLRDLANFLMKKGV